MNAIRISHRLWSSALILVSVMVAVSVLPACGANQTGSSVNLEATAVDSYFGAFSFSYPAGWEAPLLDAPPGAHTFGWLEFVPPGESHDDVYILYSRGYEGLPTFHCSLEVTLDGRHSFRSWGDCIVNAMKADSGYSNISHRQANGGKIQLIEAVHGDRNEMWAFVYTTSFTGTITIGALTFSVTPSKLDQYRPYADAMMSSFRAT